MVHQDSHPSLTRVFPVTYANQLCVREAKQPVSTHLAEFRGVCEDRHLFLGRFLLLEEGIQTVEQQSSLGQNPKLDDWCGTVFVHSD